MPEDHDPQQLIAKGKLTEAARLLEQQEQHARAADLYEQLWDFAAAARVARAGGDLPRALDNLLQTHDASAISELVDHIGQQNPQVIQSCAAVCEQRGAFEIAARLHRFGSSLARSASCLERAGLYLEAARCHEQDGDLKRAMALYRRQLDLWDGSPNEEAQTAASALGRLLLRFGENEQALPLLQKPWQQEQHADTLAGRAVVAGLSRMGYERGARYALDLLRRNHPGLELPDCLGDPRWAPLGSEDRDRPVLSGRYRLDQLLGSGGMGRVYLATDLLTEKQVAVKIFSAPAGTGGRDAFRLFLKEARTTGQLHHPHIVNLLDLSEDSGYIVLEHMAGGTLAQRLHPRLDLAACRGVLLQLLSGLAAAHQRGIIHRDIKPSNIFFSTAGAAKLGDFGVAHLQDMGQTQTGAFIGTLAYMSPEQIRGNPITFATDIYALGITLFQMLTGELPFSPPDLIGKHLTATPPAPSSVIAELPQAWDELVLSCLAKEPDNRFESLAALRHAIEQLPADEKAPAVSGALRQERPQEHQRRATDHRFALESTLHDSDDLAILGALDNKLGRRVIVIRLAPGPRRQPLLELLAAAASEGDEHLQRVLSLDTARGQAVLQVPMGDQLDQLPQDLRTRYRLAEQLGLALAPLHRAGLTHGAISISAIASMGDSCTLLLTEALLPGARASAADDVAAVLELLSLSAKPAPEDGAALARWAMEQRSQLEEDRRNERYRSQLEEALATAPDGVDRT